MFSGPSYFSSVDIVQGFPSVENAEMEAYIDIDVGGWSEGLSWWRGFAVLRLT
jgi:hypothetical protein